MVSAGPAVSPPGGGLTVRVMLTVRETLPASPVAVIVMVLNPTTRGMFKATQVESFNTARPDGPALVDHVTNGGPSPPVTVPETEIVAAVVVAGMAFTVKLGGGTTIWRVTFTV